MYSKERKVGEKPCKKIESVERGRCAWNFHWSRRGKILCKTYKMLYFFLVRCRWFWVLQILVEWKISAIVDEIYPGDMSFALRGSREYAKHFRLWIWNTKRSQKSWNVCYPFSCFINNFGSACFCIPLLWIETDIPEFTILLHERDIRYKI